VSAGVATFKFFVHNLPSREHAPTVQVTARREQEPKKRACRCRLESGGTSPTEGDED